MKHEDYKEMLKLEALDALDETESHDLREHLSTCIECRAEIDELRAAAAQLIHLTTPVPTPPQLRARILESIGALKTESSSSTIAIKDEERKNNPKGTGSTILPPSQSTRRKWNSFATFGLIAASIVFVALIIWLVVIWNRDRTRQVELARLSSSNDEAQKELARLSRRNDELETELRRLTDHNDKLEGELARLTQRGYPSQERVPGQPEVAETPTTPFTPDLRTVALAGTDKAPGASASLVYNNLKKTITFNVNGLPPAPVGKAYQLWYLVDGRPIPGGVFITGPGGRAQMRWQIPSEAQNATAYAVTLEPSGGSRTPTGDKYLLGSAS